jgi:hypothetical protein
MPKGDRNDRIKLLAGRWRSSRHWRTMPLPSSIGWNARLAAATAIRNSLPPSARQSARGGHGCKSCLGCRQVYELDLRRVARAADFPVIIADVRVGLPRSGTEAEATGAGRGTDAGCGWEQKMQVALMRCLGLAKPITASAMLRMLYVWTLFHHHSTGGDCPPVSRERAASEHSGSLQCCTGSGPAGQIHDRMPAILATTEFERWLGDEPDPHDLLRPFPSEPMLMWPISTRVNKPENDDPGILEMLAAG